MTPTQSEVNHALAQIEAEEDDQLFYHELGEHNHNRQLARERIAQYRAATVDDIIETRITGTRSRWPVDADSTVRLARIGQVDVPKQKSLFKPLCLIVGMLLIGYAIFRILVF